MSAPVILPGQRVLFSGSCIEITLDRDCLHSSFSFGTSLFFACEYPPFFCAGISQTFCLVVSSGISGVEVSQVALYDRSPWEGWVGGTVCPLVCSFRHAIVQILVHSLSVTRNGTKTFYRARTLDRSRSLLLVPLANSPTCTTLVPHLHSQSCSFSTSSSRFTQKSVSDVKQEGVPPSPPPLKKHKVELRPAPMKTPKPQVLAGPPPVQAVSPHPTVIESQSSKTDEASTASSAEKPESIKDTNKRDLEVASQHGILAPPPEGSSRFYKLFHQAKELFVSNICNGNVDRIQKVYRNSTTGV